MIESFVDKNTERLYVTGKSKKYSAAIIKMGIKKLDYLNGAENLEDLKAPPGNRLKILKGNYAGKYSIRINDQYRIVFKFKDSNAYQVEITDYH